MNLIDIKDLIIHYITNDGTICAVNGLNLSIKEGETVGLVGETGAGKSTTALGILRLIADPPGKIINGEIYFQGKDLLKIKSNEMRRIRGNSISMIFQDPMTALNPILTVGEQIAEVFNAHGAFSKAEAVKEALKMLELVGIRAERFSDFPHQFSGGMKQRVVIAMALACNPKLLIADEPTTALDVTIQAQVLNMIDGLKEKFKTSMLFISHDLGVIAEICDKVAIMYAGEIVEYGTLQDIYENTYHPYTKGLFGSIPSLDKKIVRLQPIVGLMPDPSNLPNGCKFHPRCPYKIKTCENNNPSEIEIESGHFVKCLLY